MIQARLHHYGQGLVEHLRGGRIQALRSRSAGPLASNPIVHQCRSAMEISVSSTSHHGGSPPPGRTRIGPSDEVNRVMRRVLPTRCQPGGRPRTAGGGLSGNDHLCQCSMRPHARSATSSVPGLPAKGFHVQRPATADLHRQLRQLRIQEIHVLT